MMKPNTKKLTILAGLLAAIAASRAMAQPFAPWEAVETWDSYAPGSYTADDGNLPHPIAQFGGMGQVDIFSEIEGANGNAAWVWYGTQLANAGSVVHQIALPTPVAPNTTATLYYRIWQSSYNMNWHVMVSKVPAGEEPDNTALWGNQAAIMRYDPNSAPLMVDIRNGGSYNPSNPVWLPELTTWYEYWLVLDNSYDAEGKQAGVGGYEVFVREWGSESAPTLLTWGGDTTVTRLDFRNQAEANLETLTIDQNAWQGAAGETWLIDDIFLASGRVLTSPYEEGGNNGGDGMWCGIEKVGPDVNTGDWMGWLLVGEATDAPVWAYSYTLDTYVYIGECPSENGAWVYVMNM